MIVEIDERELAGLPNASDGLIGPCDENVLVEDVFAGEVALQREQEVRSGLQLVQRGMPLDRHEFLTGRVLNGLLNR